MPPASVPGSHTRTKDLVKNTASTLATHPEDFAKDIEWIMETAGPTVSTGSYPSTKCRVPVPVISRPLVLVNEDFVRLTELLEFLFRPNVTGIFVRMKFNGKFSIRLFDILGACVPVYTQYIVVISFRSHCYVPAPGVTASSLTGAPFETTTFAGRINRSFNR